MLLITSFSCADMPKPKRIKNLVKSVVGSDKSVANYVLECMALNKRGMNCLKGVFENFLS